MFHGQPLPSAEHSYRFCVNFQTNDFWYSELHGSHEFFPMFMQIARLGKDLEPGVLYCYENGVPNTVKPVKRLRTPDHENCAWLTEED